MTARGRAAPLLFASLEANVLEQGYCEEKGGRGESSNPSLSLLDLIKPPPPPPSRDPAPPRLPHFPFPPSFLLRPPSFPFSSASVHPSTHEPPPISLRQTRNLPYCSSCTATHGLTFPPSTMPRPRSLPIALIVLSLVALVLAQPAIVFTPTKGQKRSEPSRAMGRRKQHAVQQAQQSLEASRKDYSSFLCSTNASACPAPVAGSSMAAVTDTAPATLADWFKIGFECLDLRTELTSCGGCQSLGQGCVPSPYNPTSAA